MSSTSDPAVDDSPAAPDPVDATRPFGAHLTMRWWVPVVLSVAVIACIYILQLILAGAAAIIEVGLLGKSVDDKTLTPLTHLATNLATIAIAPLALVLLATIGRVPWRAALSVGRAFGWGRLGRYVALFTVLMVLGNAAVQLVNPTPLSLLTVSGTTIALLVVTLLTTPLQSAAEEVAFRGVLTASYASWIRAARPALIVGITGSTVLFAVAHTSTDPWMILNYLGLGASTAIMALLSRGLEAPIAFHAMNNVFAYGIGSLFSDGGGIPQERGGGAGGPYMLVFLVVEAVAVIIVWQIEKRRARTSPASTA